MTCYWNPQSRINQSKKNKPFVCSNCGASYSKSSSLTSHLRHDCELGEKKDLRLGHRSYVKNLDIADVSKLLDPTKLLAVPVATVKPFTCSSCGVGFMREKILKVHMARECDDVHLCNLCGNIFPNYRSLQNHKRRDTSDSLSFESLLQQLQENHCRFCYRLMDTAATEEHEINCHENPESSNFSTKESQSQCEYCNRTFATKGTLSRHLMYFCTMNRTSASFQSDIRQFICQRCGTCFKRKSHLDEHTRHDCGRTHQCEFCKRMFAYSRSLKQHLKQSCSILFTIGNEWIPQHIEVNNSLMTNAGVFVNEPTSIVTQNNFSTSRGQTNVSLRRWACPKCHHSYKNAADMKKHYRFWCGQSPRFTCPYCGNRRYQTPTRSLRMHHAGLSFPCPKCSSVFGQKRSLTTHLRYECGQLPRFKCPYCPHVSKKKSNVQKHIRRMHQNDVVFVLDILQRQQYYNQTLDTYLPWTPQTSQSTVEEFRCHKCNGTFRRAQNLQMHLKFACGQPPRFNCPYCQYRTRYVPTNYKAVRFGRWVRRRQRRANQLLIDPSAPKFPCTNCQSVFSRKHNLQYHLKFECGQMPRFNCPYCAYLSVKKSQYLMASDPLVASTMKYPCPNCSSVYSRDFTLKSHLKYECGLAPRFKCPYCNWMSKRAGNIIGHVRRMHADLKPYVVDILGEYKPRKSDPLSIMQNSEYLLMQLKDGQNDLAVAAKRFVCPNLCGSSFSHSYSLTRHLRYECGQQPRFKCPYCELYYKRTSNVTQHIRTRHANCKTYAIDIIDNKIVGIARYLQASSMAWYPHKYPRKDYHTSFRNERYCCPKCLKSYSSKSAVTSHYKYDCDKPPRFQCSKLSNTSDDIEFQRKWIKDNHTLFNIISGKYHCPNCNNGYGRRDTMLGHYRYECGKAPRFKCPYCHLCSKKTSNIYQHVRSVHPNKTVTLVKLY
ncbi:hypothetical protein PV326_004921 [Microctonus aethiopoides]|nr:hypothetical protein PV326_004921 [Microctonus aethiopoides]